MSSRKEEQKEEVERTGCRDGFVGDNVVEGYWTVLLDPEIATKEVRIQKRSKEEQWSSPREVLVLSSWKGSCLLLPFAVSRSEERVHRSDSFGEG